MTVRHYKRVSTAAPTKEEAIARYSKSHKGETRNRIIDLASKRFRAEGIDGVGVATLMADAGLTNGGFYAHFDSKEELIKEAVVHALPGIPSHASRETEDSEPDVPAFIRAYLSTAHCANPATGCAIAALSPDLGRRPPDSRKAIHEKGMTLIDYIAAGLPAATVADERFSCAVAVFSHLLGTLQLARFVMDQSVSKAILRRGRVEAMRIAGFEAAAAASGKRPRKAAKTSRGTS